MIHVGKNESQNGKYSKNMTIATATKKVFLHNTRLIKTIYMPMMIHVGKKELEK